VLQLWQMGDTLTVRLPKDLLERLRRTARRAGLPLGRVVRESLETTLSNHEERPWRKYAGVIKGGPADVSSRKGFSRE
jgi:predicted DNA-binding protein